MNAPTASDDSNAAIRDLIIRLSAEIGAGARPAAPGQLDFARAAATITRCAGGAGLTPALTPVEADELARAFMRGDDTPFIDYAADHDVPPSLAGEIDVDELLALCALLAAREQWSGGAQRVEPSAGPAQLEAVCPTCGSLARLEFLLGQFSERYAACPACDAYWRITRVGCPQCGESDGARVVIYNAAGQSGRALAHCRSCGRVWRRLELKMDIRPPNDLFIQALEPWPEEELLDQNENVRPTPLRPRRGAIP